VLQLHKIEGISLNEIERETGVCKMKMSRIKRKATTKLKALLNQ
jgi:DNA-directed RNA polymerase specialized sigma subunit